MKRLVSGLLPWLLCACSWLGGGPRGVEVVEDPAVLGFAERIASFYGALEEVPLDVFMTFTNPRLRTYFRDETEFSDYYASLASQVREAQFQNGRSERVLVREFRFEGPDLAHVDVVFMGHHQRRLRFWQIEIPRTDTWRRLDGEWILSPEKL